MGQYKVSEIFSSIQGEGARAGTRNVFIRLAGCNLKCAIAASDISPGGFDCDTDFESGEKMTLEEILLACEPFKFGASHVILTGGEPMLQVDDSLLAGLHSAGWKIAIETNGSKEVPDAVDYICVSPKVAEHAIRQLWADEVRYVRGPGQPIPKPRVKANRYFISPAFDGLTLSEESLLWAQKLVRENPPWELSVQQHKMANLR